MLVVQAGPDTCILQHGHELTAGIVTANNARPQIPIDSRLVEDTDQPLKIWEGCIQRWLVKPADVGRLHAEHNLDGLLRGDSTARAAYMGVMADKGLRTRNELRRVDNLPPLPGGEVATCQSQNVPLTHLGKTNPAPSGV